MRWLKSSERLSSEEAGVDLPVGRRWILYYAVGIGLAFAFKDNRAFCEYVCPITVFLKPMSYFFFLRIKCDKQKCVFCGKCRRVCPMNVDVTDNSRRRKNGTECILCMECVKACPKKAL